jgi:hypothetical protein
MADFPKRDNKALIFLAVLMTDAVGFSETSLFIKQSTWRNSPEGPNLQRKLNYHKGEFYMNIRRNN